MRLAAISILIWRLLTTGTVAAAANDIGQSLSGAWKDAAEFANSTMQQLHGKSRQELLELPNRQLLNSTGLPSPFEAAIEQGAMLNGTVFVEVEVGQYLSGGLWQAVISAFEVTPEGKLTVHPQRIERTTAEERKRSLKWRSG